jgi:hypothetical protein
MLKISLDTLINLNDLELRKRDANPSKNSQVKLLMNTRFSETKSNKSASANPSQIAVFVFVYSAIIFVLSFFELESLGRKCYYSDSEYYYEMFVSDVPWHNCDGALYIAVLRVLGSLFNSYIFAKCFLFCVYMALVLFLYQRFSRHNVLFLLYMLHPFCVFSFIRGMKESVIMISYLIAAIVFKMSKSAVIWLVTIVSLATGMAYLRPVGQYLVSAAFIVGILTKKYSFAKLSLIYFIMVFGMWSELPIIGQILEDHRSSYSEVKVEYFLPIQPFVFIFGPTPIKPVLHIFGSNIYEFATPITMVTLFVGSIVSLLLAKDMWNLLKTSGDNYGRSIFVFSAVLWMAGYVIIYGGQAEVRYRGVFFVIMGISAIFCGESKTKSGWIDRNQIGKHD